MEEKLELRTDVDSYIASEALGRLLGSASHLESNWYGPVAADTPQEFRKSIRTWAAAALGTLEMIYESVVPGVAGHLRTLVQSTEALETLYPEFTDALQWIRDEHLRLGASPPSGTKVCPLCGDTRFGMQENEEDAGILAIDHCTHFRTVDTAWFALLSPERRKELAWFVHTRQKRGYDHPVLCPGSLNLGQGTFSVADIRSIVPKNIGAIHDELLLTIAEVARQESPVQPVPTETERGRFGRYVALDSIDAPLGFATSLDGLRFHVDELKNNGYLAEQHEGLADFINVRLTLEGWRRVEQLEQGAVEKPYQGFVAMWFSEELEIVYSEGIEPAIRAAGYDAMQMSFLEHNDDINDRIIAEIRKSRFVVADFTGNRGGVYFEAGFALGLGKPVIWTCNRAFFEKHGVHFDTQARNHILWDKPEDLRRSLHARIEATVPRSA